MTLPTKLTILRIALTFVIMALLFLSGWVAKALALGCFLLASATDWLDGFLARRWRQLSPLGALLDPIADKILVLGVFLTFVQLRLVPAWIVLIILFRELLITSVRMVAASRGVVLAAAKEGKHKTVSQMVTIIVILTALVIREWPRTRALEPSTATAITWIIFSCLWVTVGLTVISGASFFWRHRDLLKGAMTR